MTLPDERLRSLKRAREFLFSLLDPSRTPKVPKIIRKEASAVLKHFPYSYQLDQLAELDPDTYELRGEKDLD
jgi:hypothetical protein